MPWYSLKIAELALNNSHSLTPKISVIKKNTKKPGSGQGGDADEEKCDNEASW